MKPIKTFGVIIGVIGIIGMVHTLGPEASFFVFIAMWGNNILNNNRL